MKSSICGFTEGSTGQTHGNFPIPREMDPVPDLKCRVIFQDGRFTSDATQEDRARLAHKLQPVVYRESADLRAWAADIVQRKNRVRGRPTGHAHLRPDIERMRLEGVSWPEVGRRLRISPEAARMVMMDRKKRAGVGGAL